MKAVSLIRAGEARIIDVREPVVPDGDLLLKIEMVGLCGSDLNSYRGKNPLVTYPRIPGHEIAATVLKGNSSIRSGSRVTVSPYTNCGICPSCMRGRENACCSNQTFGVQRDGGLTEMLAVPAGKVYPSALPLEDLCLVEPLTVGFHAVARGRVTREDTVAVFGCGGVGLGAISGAAYRGAHVIAIDLDDKKLATAKMTGATDLIHSGREDVRARLREITDNNGPDVVIEAIGLPETFRLAEGQETQAITANMATAFQHVLSDNSVPVFVSTTLGRGALIDSELLGTNASSVTAITIATGNRLYFKDVSCSGYGICESDNGSPLPTLPAEGWTGAAQTIFDSGSTPGALPISDTETPIPVDPAASTWTMLGSDSTGWCSTITSSTSTTVYLPPGTYTSSANVSCTIPDTVNHLLMYDSKNSAATAGTTYTFTVAGSSPTPLVIDGCMHQSCSINHTGLRTLVIRDTNGGYQGAAGAGNVYFEDAAIGGYLPKSTNEPGPTFYSSQLVTGRQLISKWDRPQIRLFTPKFSVRGRTSGCWGTRRSTIHLPSLRPHSAKRIYSVSTTTTRTRRSAAQLQWSSPIQVCSRPDS